MYVIKLTAPHAIIRRIADELDDLMDGGDGSDDCQGISCTLFDPNAMPSAAGGSDPGADPHPDALWDMSIYSDEATMVAIEACLDQHRHNFTSYHQSVLDDAINWLEASYKSLPPLRVGNFFIHGAHVVDLPKDDSLRLCIDASTAFGSGEHPTTKGCLLTLESLAGEGFKPSMVLDLGCGSGILGMAASRLWTDARVLCVDNDPEAVRKTKHFAGLNGIAGPKFGVLCSDGFEGIVPGAPGLEAYDGEKFDLIIANILASPLVALADACREHLKIGGRLILSGLLTHQAPEVLAAYMTPTQGGASLEEGNSLVLDGWSTLQLRFR